MQGGQPGPLRVGSGGFTCRASWARAGAAVVLGLGSSHPVLPGQLRVLGGMRPLPEVGCCCQGFSCLGSASLALAACGGGWEHLHPDHSSQSLGPRRQEDLKTKTRGWQQCSGRGLCRVAGQESLQKNPWSAAGPWSLSTTVCQGHHRASSQVPSLGNALARLFPARVDTGHCVGQAHTSSPQERS